MLITFKRLFLPFTIHPLPSTTPTTPTTVTTVTTITTLTTLLLLLLTSSPSFSQTITGPLPTSRPSVGLVLSGGGAKGFAYVGLLRVIREAGLPIDYIGGSSIGSIIGGLYALGYHPDSIAQLIRSQNWDDLLKDISDRKYVAYEEKEFGENNLVTLPLKNKKIGYSAMYKGKEINLLLNYYFSPAYNIHDFRKLPTPFLCIGTNLLTGEQVVLDKGYLPLAIRASMSIPGYFTPTDYMGYYLVDGGVVNNYPAKEVKELGAGIILGGDVQSGLYRTREELSTLPVVLDQITSFSRIKANEIGDSLTDLKVRIKMDYGMMDFDSYDSIMAIGERIARSHFREIKALADSLNAIEYKPIGKYEATPLKHIHVGKVIIKGNQKISDEYLQRSFNNLSERDITLDELHRQIRLTYGTGFFDNINYSFENENNKTDLVLQVSESGPGDLGASVNYNGQYGISIGLAGAFRNVAMKNSKVFVNLNLASEPLLRVQYLRGFGNQSAAELHLETYNFKADQYNKNLKTNQFKMTNYKASLLFSRRLKNMAIMKAGFDYEYFRIKQEFEIDTTIARYNSFSSYGTLFFSLGLDNRDKRYFATRGVKASFRFEYVLPLSKNWSKDIFTNSVNFHVKFEDNIPLNKKLVLKPGLFAGATLRDHVPPVQHWFAVGGQMEDNYISTFVPFTGLNFIQKTGYYAWIGRMNVQYNIFRKIYLNVNTDIGAAGTYLEDVFMSRNIMAGYGITASYNSFVGPLKLSMMGSNMNPGVMFFLNLGFWL